MKIIQKLLIVSLFLVGVTTPVVSAQNSRNQSENQVRAQTTQVLNTQSEQGDSAARIADRKEQQDVNLSQAAQNRLQARCKGAQGKISSISNRIKGLQTSRSEKYTNLQSRLQLLVSQLQLRQYDTKNLEALISELSQLIQASETNMETYQIALTDLSGMDCEADPEGFQATLEAARAGLETVKQSTQDIKTFLLESMKPELQTIRAGLQKPEEDAQTDGQSSPADTEPEQVAPDTPVSNEEIE